MSTNTEQTEFEFDDLPEQNNPRLGGRVVEPEAEVPAEIEVVDDTPEADRGRKPAAEPPKDVTDEELGKYDESVQKRIKHFTKGFHDERRAKEAAQREKDEALRLAQAVLEENKRLKGSIGQNQQTMLEQAKRVSAAELADAKRKYKDAYESGDAEALVAAQEALTQATVRADKIANYRPAPVQKPENEVQIPQPAQEQAPVAQPDPRAAEWQSQNPWFGQDEEMTSFALGLHTKMVRENVDPTSDEYYARLNSRMRQVFPDAFEQEKPVDAPSQRSKASVVAPATRSTAPKKIVLTQTQVNIAKRLGVPLEQYAREVAKQMMRN